MLGARAEGQQRTKAAEVVQMFNVKSNGTHQKDLYFLEYLSGEE